MIVNRKTRLKSLTLLFILFIVHITLTGCTQKIIQSIQILAISPETLDGQFVVVTEQQDVNSAINYGADLQLFNPANQSFTPIRWLAYSESIAPYVNIHNNLCVNTLTRDAFYLHWVVPEIALSKINLATKTRTTVSQGGAVIGTGVLFEKTVALACDDVRNKVYVLGGDTTTLTAVDVTTGNRSMLFQLENYLPKDLTIDSARNKIYILARSTQDIVIVYDIESNTYTQLIFNGASPATYINYYKLEGSLLLSTTEQLYTLDTITGESTVRYAYGESETPALQEVPIRVTRILDDVLVDARQFNVMYSRAMLNLFPAPGDGSDLIKVMQQSYPISYLYGLNLSTDQYYSLESRRIKTEYPSILNMMKYNENIAKYF